MIPARIIERKRDGEAVEAGALRGFLHAYLRGEVPDYQMAAFLMAVYFRGLDETETDTLVSCMLESGEVLDLSYLDAPRVDKHSTGGVGDKISLVLAPLVASLGVYVPMMSGRGLGHTTGTLDKLEAIPGFRTALTLDEFRSVLERVGCAMIGQTAEIAPLDRRLYALRDVTGTVPVRALIAASIMSKKLAEGLTGLVLDVKVGEGAFMPEEDRALALAREMVRIGTARRLPTVALLTAMDRPLGCAVGNGLETAEAIRCLQGEGPEDLRALVLLEAAEMLLLAEGAQDDDPERRADALARAGDALDGGAALERFVRLVEAQGGDPAIVDDPDRLRSAPVRRVVEATCSGVVRRVRPRLLGEAVVELGGGRRRMDDPIDPRVGFELQVRPGDAVAVGAPLCTVHAASEADADLAEARVRSAIQVADEGAEGLRPLVSHRVDASGVRVLGDREGVATAG